MYRIGANQNLLKLFFETLELIEAIVYKKTKPIHHSQGVNCFKIQFEFNIELYFDGDNYYNFTSLDELMHTFCIYYSYSYSYYYYFFYYLD